MAGYLARKEGKTRDKNIFVKDITPESYKQWDDGWKIANKEFEEYRKSFR
jgi:hypothetical protein